MFLNPADTPHQVHVRNEYDVVAIRQHVREVAQEIGLGLAAQAKLAAVISGVARALLDHQRRASFSVQMASEGGQTSLEIGCTTSLGASQDAPGLVRDLGIGDMRQLLDDMSVTQRADDVVLTLRMRLAHHR